jgi:hypothetical protein
MAIIRLRQGAPRGYRGKDRGRSGLGCLYGDLARAAGGRERGVRKAWLERLYIVIATPVRFGSQR